MTTILIIGIKESANFNTTIVFVKLIAVLTFIVVATAFVLKNPQIAHANWKVFLPPNTGTFGSYGWSGVLRGAGVVFFAYIGFDAVSTAAREARKPQKDMPIGILGSLAVCTVLYIIVCALLTATVHYSRLNIGAPVSLAIRETGVKWGSYVVNAGALAGLSTVMLVMLLGQSRVFYSMAHDGLLWKWAGDIHPRFRTPWKSTAVVGLLVAIVGAVVPIGDLGQVRLHRHPSRFRDCLRRGVGHASAAARIGASIQDAVGSVFPHHGHHHLSRSDVGIEGVDLGEVGSLAGYRNGHLLHIQRETQPRAKREQIIQSTVWSTR